MKTRPIVKCHGGKFYLCDWIISHFPSNAKDYTYIEPFVGGGSVFFNKPRVGVSVLNDLDSHLVNIYSCLKSEDIFLDKLRKVSYNKQTFEQALLTDTKNLDKIELAINEYILRRMSRGGLKKSFAWSTRLRGGLPGDVNAWNTAITQLPILRKKLVDNHALIRNDTALSLLMRLDHKKCFVYCDPPYLHETRVSKKAYSKEMKEDDHIELADILNTYKGKVLLSGYHSPLYDKLYKNWRCIEKQIVNHSSQQKKKPIKTEVLWANY